VFETALSAAPYLGLMTEKIHRATGQLLRNFPRA